MSIHRYHALLEHSIIGFLKAIETLEKLKVESNFEEFDKHWRDFLTYLERCWDKSQEEGQIYKTSLTRGLENLRIWEEMMRYCDI